MRSKNASKINIYCSSLLVVCILFSLLFCFGYQQDIAGQEQAVANTADNEQLKLVFIDVGQGDSILLVAPNGQAMLIDGGDQEASAAVLAALAAADIEELACIVATHPHSDHIGGLPAVFAKTTVKSVCMPKVSHDTLAFEKFLTAIKNEGSNIIWAQAGGFIAIDDNLKIEIKSPFLQEHSNLNNYSVVLHIIYKEKSFLLMGDAEAEVERHLAGLQADLLKVGHHGSQGSSDDLLLRALGAQAAVISCGKANDYGHPHEQTLEALAKYNMTIYRTDLNGNITVLCDGKKIAVEVEKQ